MFTFLLNRPTLILTAALIGYGGLYYALPSTERPLMVQPLVEIPRVIGSWVTLQESQVEPEVQKVLRADDTIIRTYGSSGQGAAVTLFVAMFKSQRNGQAPHSPKNCLPGSGWAPLRSEITSIAIPGEGRNIDVNHYVVQRGQNLSIVYYWYQSHDRVVASEYAAKVWLVLDAVRYRRSDTSLVRITVPAMAGGMEAAEKAAVAFIQDSFPSLRRVLPS